jgi:hypothetical protein
MFPRQPVGFVHQLDEQPRFEEIFDVSFFLPRNIRRENNPLVLKQRRFVKIV